MLPSMHGCCAPRPRARRDHRARERKGGMAAESALRSTYGPCALIAGAAVGLGAEYSRQVAERGLDLVLIDRDAAPLAATADEIRARHGVQVRTISVDLSRPD